MKKKLTSLFAAAALAVNLIPTVPFAQPTAYAATSQRAMENLSRGLLVIKNGNNMQLSWRLLGTESYDTSFNVYRDGYIIANVTDSTFYLDGRGDGESMYQIAPVVNGVEGEKCTAAKQWDSDTNYLEFTIPIPTGGDNGTMLHNSSTYTYTVNDMSTGDLDGDGDYEIVVKYMPTNAGEAGTGYTGNVMLGAYELDGTPLWTDTSGNVKYIDLGMNVRANPHGVQFLVYDFNQDGIAEIATKTAQGTMDTQGHVLVESSTGPDYYTVESTSDYTTDTLYNKSTSNSFSRVNTGGTVLHGREYYTMYNGYTGAFIDTVAYHTPRTFTQYSSHSTNNKTELEYLWGDNWGNRVDRLTDTVAFLDGETPYAVEWRGYYHGNGNPYGRTAVGAYKLVGNELVNQYTFDTAGDIREKYESGTLSWDDIFGSTSNATAQLVTNNPDYIYCGNGNHNMVAADFDEDGLDEVASGSLCLQLKDGEFGVKWNYNRGHGDAFHLGRYVKGQGLLYFLVHEHGRSYTETVTVAAQTLDPVTTTDGPTEADYKEGDTAGTTTTNTTETVETILERIDDNNIRFQIDNNDIEIVKDVTVSDTTTTTTTTTTTVTTRKEVHRNYTSGTGSASGRGYGMSVIDPRADGEVDSNGIVGEPTLIFYEDAGGDTGRGIMLKGGEGFFQIDSSGNDARKVTYNSATADDIDDTDGEVSKNGYTFINTGTTAIGVQKNGDYSCNSRIYWDGDVYDEALDGFTSSDKVERVIMGNYNESTGYWERVDDFSGTWTNNSTKNNVCISADLIGDWREEFICRVADSEGTLRLYTSNYSTDAKVYTLMHDSQYRSGVASEQAAYNQPPHVSWYMGEDMDMAADKPNITTVAKTVDVTPVSTQTPERTYDSATAASMVWQNNTPLSGDTYTGYVLDTAYDSGVQTFHMSVMSESNATFNLRDSSSSSINTTSSGYNNMITVVSFSSDEKIYFNKNNWSSGSYTAGRWYDIDVTIDFSAQTQDVYVTDVETGECVAYTTNMGFRQSGTDVKRIAWISGETDKSVYIKNCAIFTGDAPTRATITAADKVQAGSELAVETVFKTISNVEPTNWISGTDIIYTLYKDNLYTPVDATITATENGVLFDSSVPVGDYILEVYDGINAYAYADISVLEQGPISVTNDDIVLEVNGLTGSSVSSTIYTDKDFTQTVSKSDIGIERKTSVLSMLAKISQNCIATPEYTIEAYKVTISQGDTVIAEVEPTVFEQNGNIFMSQFVGDKIQPGEYSVTVELTISQNGESYTVSKAGTVTINEPSGLEEFYYTVDGINVTVFVK